MPSSRFVVIGGGIAGLRAAIALAAHGRVTVLTKGERLESNTGYAQGGVAAAVGPDDSPALHAADTLRAGDGLCDPEAVRVLVEEGPAYVRELVEWGARFDRDAAGALALGREAAHSVRRVLHAGDATGREIGRTLWDRVAGLPSIEVLADALAIDLLVSDAAVVGVRCALATGERRDLVADATLVATGGAGRVFRHTTNPAVATGDGIAMAFRAGAVVADLEFVQFHPTALDVPGAPRFLISEAVRGEGAWLVNERGERFMGRDHPDGELAPRDVVARGIAREAARTGGRLFLTLAHLDPAYVRERFPTIASACASVKLDLARDRIPVGPAAHYVMGGVATDLMGRTSMPGLFAAGEAACTGVHGANRLASNSLLEGLVFGARAAAAMCEASAAGGLGAGRLMAGDLPAGTDGAPSLPPAGARPLAADDVRDLMWKEVGLFRSRDGLAAACAALAGPPAAPDDPILANLIQVARLMAAAALRREESRGSHFRADFPARDDLHWQIHVCERRPPRR